MKSLKQFLALAVGFCGVAHAGVTDYFKDQQNASMNTVQADAGIAEGSTAGLATTAYTAARVKSFYNQNALRLAGNDVQAQEVKRELNEFISELRASKAKYETALAEQNAEVSIAGKDASATERAAADAASGREARLATAKADLDAHIAKVQSVLRDRGMLGADQELVVTDGALTPEAMALLDTAETAAVAKTATSDVLKGTARTVLRRIPELGTVLIIGGTVAADAKTRYDAAKANKNPGWLPIKGLGLYIVDKGSDLKDQAAVKIEDGKHKAEAVWDNINDGGTTH